VAQTTAPGCGDAVGPVGFRNIISIGNDETAGSPSLDRNFRGVIDEVRITDRALDPAGFVIPLGPCVTPPAGLVSWWPGDGDALDIVDGNHGTLMNGATFAPGEVRQGFSFDGVDDYVEIPFAANLAIGNAMTYDAWVKVHTTTGSYQTLFDNLGGSFTDGLLVATRPNSNALAVYVSENAEHQVPNFFDIGQFTHVAVTTDNGVTTVYKNGDLAATFNTRVLVPSTAATRFGARIVSFSQFFGGVLDEVEVYNRALSLAEIRAIFNAGRAGKCRP
jgi:hypothetical protein